MNLRFKSEHMWGQFVRTPRLLQAMASEFCAQSLAEGVSPLCTRVSDPIEGESGVHLAMRALDFRDQVGPAFTYREESRKRLLEFFNTKYARNDGKPTLLWHSFNNGPKHFHLQVAANEGVYLSYSNSNTKGLSMSVGIKDLEDCVVLACRLVGGIEKSAQGGFSLEDLGNLYPVMLAVPEAISGISEVPAQASDLDVVEAEQLRQKIVEELDLSNDGVEVVVESVLGIALKIAASLVALKAAKAPVAGPA